MSAACSRLLTALAEFFVVGGVAGLLSTMVITAHVAAVYAFVLLWTTY